MDQPWWVYGAIALGCVVLFLIAKVIETKFLKDDDDLSLLCVVLGFVGFFSAFKAADILNLFS